jgi:hypothetical protein
VRIRVGHLYPDYLNIYADRGNIAVLSDRARRRGHELDVTAIGLRDVVGPSEIDLYYVGGGEDRESRSSSPTIWRRRRSRCEPPSRTARPSWLFTVATNCRTPYRDVAGVELPGIRPAAAADDRGHEAHDRRRSSSNARAGAHAVPVREPRHGDPARRRGSR